MPKDDVLFDKIARDIEARGYSINLNALSGNLARSLEHQVLKKLTSFRRAGVGRTDDYQKNQNVRSDNIMWIDDSTEAGADWLSWAQRLQDYLNRRLLLGLFSFESHFAHYPPGAFYQRHVDAFKGESNRLLSLVVYLNEDWVQEKGGELVLYRNEKDKDGIKVFPAWATVVVFLSEEFPHEVLPSTQDRVSIAGWFRLNTSSGAKVDPPA